MRVALEAMPQNARVETVARLWLALSASRAFRSPKTWGTAVLVVQGGSVRVTSRVDFASWLRANALPQLATECLHRKTRRGEVLVFFDGDAPEAGARTEFLIIDLAREARELRRVVETKGTST